MTDIFTTKQDAIEQAIIPAFSDAEYGGLEWDLDAIADEILTFDTATDEDGTVHLDRQGFRVREDVDFWEVAGRHEREIFTLTIPEVGEQWEITDADGEEVDGVAVAESEEWEPATYDQAIRGAWFERIDDWQTSGAEHTCHLVRI